uniref:(northern house mosquito) hypothetical protein n=1 Tax=Culex pipiens TaxID=7175 RepID=A0A8D8BWU7_CULPI
MRSKRFQTPNNAAAGAIGSSTPLRNWSRIVWSNTRSAKRQRLPRTERFATSATGWWASGTWSCTSSHPRHCSAARLVVSFFSPSDMSPGMRKFAVRCIRLRAPKRTRRSRARSVGRRLEVRNRNVPMSTFITTRFPKSVRAVARFSPISTSTGHI